MVCTDEVMGVPAGHMDAHGIAKRINQSVDFGAQSATGTTNGLIFAGFFFAPALC
jgi:hypothetical protein